MSDYGYSDDEFNSATESSPSAARDRKAKEPPVAEAGSPSASSTSSTCSHASRSHRSSRQSSTSSSRISHRSTTPPETQGEPKTSQQERAVEKPRPPQKKRTKAIVSTAEKKKQKEPPVYEPSSGRNESEAPEKRKKKKKKSEAPGDDPRSTFEKHILSLNRTGEALSLRGNTEEAESALRQAYVLLQRKGDAEEELAQEQRDSLLCTTLNNLGCHEQRKGNLPQALRFFEACSRVEKKRNVWSAVTLLNMSTVAHDAGQSLAYAKEALMACNVVGAASANKRLASVKTAASYRIAEALFRQFQLDIQSGKWGPPNMRRVLEVNGDCCAAANDVVKSFQRSLQQHSTPDDSQASFIRQRSKEVRLELKGFLSRYDGEVPSTQRSERQDVTEREPSFSSRAPQRRQPNTARAAPTSSRKKELTSYFASAEGRVEQAQVDAKKNKSKDHGRPLPVVHPTTTHQPAVESALPPRLVLPSVYAHTRQFYTPRMPAFLREAPRYADDTTLSRKTKRAKKMEAPTPVQVIRSTSHQTKQKPKPKEFGDDNQGDAERPPLPIDDDELFAEINKLGVEDQGVEDGSSGQNP